MAVGLRFLGSIGVGGLPDSTSLVAESHSGKWAVTAGFNYAARSVQFEIIDRTTHTTSWTIPGSYPYSVSNYRGQVETMVAFSPDDGRIAVGGTTLSEYDVRTHHLLWRHTNVRINAVAYSADGTTIAAGGALPIVAAYASRSGLERWRVNHGSIVVSTAVDPHAAIIASGSDGGGVRLWEMHGGRELPHLRIPHLDGGRHWQAALDGYLAHEGRVLDLGFTKSGTLITGAGDGSMRLWDPIGGRMLAERICPVAVNAISIGTAGAVASCFESGPALFDPGTLLAREYFGEDNGGTEHVWAVPDGWLVYGGDGTMKKWNAANFTTKTLAGEIESAALAPGGDLLAYSYGDRIVHIASIAGGTQVAQISGVQSAKYGCCFGRRVLMLGMSRDTLFVDTYSTEGFVDHHGAYNGVLSAWDFRGRKLATYDGVTASQIVPFDDGRFLTVTAPAMTDTPWSATLIDRRTARVTVWTPKQTVSDRLSHLELFNSAAPIEDGGPAVVTEVSRSDVNVLQERELPSGRVVRTFRQSFQADQQHGIVQDRENQAIAVGGAIDGLTVFTLGGETISRNLYALGDQQLAGMDASGGRVAFLTQPHTYDCDGSYHVHVFSERSGREVASVSKAVCAQSVQLSDDGRTLAVQTKFGVDIYAVR
ncbi:MAG TPA: WD40 repeat domain-containing protein [Candidatus Baltobacteraceae bacterium]|nr:WD40 repeat domain-containing protein [Candidatus Baltobacteraceae bacterium]